MKNKTLEAIGAWMFKAYAWLIIVITPFLVFFGVSELVSGEVSAGIGLLMYAAVSVPTAVATHKLGRMINSSDC